MNRHRKLVALLLTLGSMIAALIVLELVLAFAWPSKIITQTYHEQYHPGMGWVNKPDMDGYYYLNNKVRFHRHHNQHGLRSLREIPYEKPAGVKRVLLIGDSFFWGFGVNDKDVVSEVLQHAMGPGIEIVNGAVTGYGTDQELLWLREEGLKYEPDVVILGCFPVNDMDEISRSVVYGGYPKPYFTLEGGRLLLKNVPVPDTRETRRKAFENPTSVFGKFKQFLRYHTHSYPFLARRLNAVPGVRKFLLETGLTEEFTPALPGVPNVQIDPERVLPLFKALISEMQAVSIKAGADFLLVFIPQKEQTPGALINYEGISEGATERNNGLSEGLTRFTKRVHIDYLDLLPIMRASLLRGEAPYVPARTDHHWTPLGHRIAAEAIKERLNTLHFSDTAGGASRQRIINSKQTESASAAHFRNQLEDRQ